MSSTHDRAVQALCQAELAGVVDLIAWPEWDGATHRPGAPNGAAHDATLTLSPDAVVVANTEGAVRLEAAGASVVLWGRSPVAEQDPMAFLPYPVELADPSPPNARNSYPYAADRLLSFFTDRRAPDVVVVHTPAHHFPDHGGHLGEHGSLDVIQSRAPLLLAGPGVTGRGVHEQHARVVDVAVTLASLAGVPSERLAGLDGSPLSDLNGATEAAHVVGVLLDGVHSSDLLGMIEAGELPALARLLEAGLALRGGAVAEFPSVTLTNHTSALTGVGPGRHGVVGNVYFDRDTGKRVVPNDATTWHRWGDWVRPGLSTVFEMVGSTVPGAMTASVNEPVDRGATYSTMALIRASERGAAAMSAALPDPRDSRFATRAQVEADASYAWSSQVDDSGLEQVLGLWTSVAAAPRLTWWSHTVTDAGHHAGGPRSAIARDSVRDADRRLGAFLDQLDSLGVTDEVAWLVTADHGSEGADPGCVGHWGEALRQAGVDARDEGPGFLYLQEGS